MPTENYSLVLTDVVCLHLQVALGSMVNQVITELWRVCGIYKREEHIQY